MKKSIINEQKSNLEELKKKIVVFGTVGSLILTSGCVGGKTNGSTNGNTTNPTSITIGDIYGSVKDVNLIFIENNKLSKDFFASVENNKKFVLVVKPIDFTYAGIYKTIDFVKSIVETYDINFPILYDINSLMASDTLTANVRLGKAFCDKLQANGCYVGFYGSDINMTSFSERYDREFGDCQLLNSYDKLITYNSDKPNYTGVYNMYMKEGQGKIYFNYDLEKIIKTANLNSSDNFISDYIYTVKLGDTFSLIADKYNMRVSDLANYNNIDVNGVLVAGQKLIIPSLYQTNSEMMKGIDISHHQGVVDFEKLKDKVDFVIVRVCTFENGTKDCSSTKLDKQFLRNISECERLNIPVGVYYYSYADNAIEAVNEAKFVIEQLKGYSLELPLYIDIEATKHQKMCLDGTIDELIVAAMTELEGAGYFSGIYCNKGHVGMRFINKFKPFYNIWLVNNDTYTNSVNFDEFDPNDPEQYLAGVYPDDYISLVQYSERGKIAGISGMVDLDYGNPELIEKVKKYYNRTRSN